MGVRRVIAGIGRLMILFGVLILLFVAYQLWGTGLAEARAQNNLEDEFQSALELAPAERPDQPVTTATTAPERPIPEGGDVVAHIEIPSIGLDKYIVEGVTVDDLKKGPGHYIDTPLPGEKGNAAVAGHRTTYGAPFYKLDELKPGDEIFVRTLQGRFVYRFEKHRIVPPSDVSVLDPTKDDRLTLTTCNPRYSARERLIAIAKLQGPAVEVSVRSTPQLEETVRTSTRSLDVSGNDAAELPAVLWGLAAASILAIIWWFGRVWRRWPVYLSGTPVFLVVLFFFFENFARILPANF